MARTLRPIVSLEHTDEREHRRELAMRVNAALTSDGTNGMTAPLELAAYATADLPDATLNEGSIVYLSDGIGPTVVYSDGADWVPFTADPHPTYTVAGLPSASLNESSIVYVTDDTGGPTIAFSDGTVWRNVRDRYPVTTGAIGDAYVDDFGAAGDGSTDDTASFDAAIAAISSTGGIVHVNPTKRYYIANDLTVSAGVTIKGGLNIVGIPGGFNDASTMWNYGSTLKLLSTKTITLMGGASLDGLFIVRSTMSGPENNAASYAGTAITIGGEDTLVISCMILGFAQAYTCTNHNRPRVERVNLDCSAGIAMSDIFDIPYVRQVHAWPFGTVDAASPVATWDTTFVTYRSGAAFAFSNVADIGKVTDCFSFGYLYGFVINGPAAMTLTGCNADGISRVSVPTVLAGTTGFLIEGATDMLTLANCGVAAQEAAYIINLTNNTQRVILSSCRCWAIEGNGVSNLKGAPTIIGGDYRGQGAVGYAVATISGSVVAIGNRFTSAGWIANVFGALTVDLGNV